MAQWKVKDGTQVKFDGTLYQPGDTFSASESQVKARSLASYVERVRESSKKAQKPSSNKAQQAPEGNKSADK